MVMFVCGMVHHTGLAWIEWPDIACRVCGGARHQGAECPTCNARRLGAADAPSLLKPWGSKDLAKRHPWVACERDES